MISYELPMALSVASVVLVVGHAAADGDRRAAGGELPPLERLRRRVAAPRVRPVHGGRLRGDEPHAVRPPEAEGELVAGYHTEYSGMRFAAFFMAEYINMMTTSGTGDHAVPRRLAAGAARCAGCPSPDGRSGACRSSPSSRKMAFFQFLFVWVRWTLPRFRYDQLMNLGWKGLLPLSLANLAFTAILVVYGVVGHLRRRWTLIAFYVLALLVIASALVVITHRNPVTAAVALGVQPGRDRRVSTWCSTRSSSACSR